MTNSKFQNIFKFNSFLKILILITIYFPDFSLSQDLIKIYYDYLPKKYLENKEHLNQLSTVLESKSKIHPEIVKVENSEKKFVYFPTMDISFGLSKFLSSNISLNTSYISLYLLYEF